MLRYSRISLALLALSSYWEGSDAVQNMDQYDEADDDYFGVPLSVAEWCSGVYNENGEYETLFCNLRLFIHVGGELLLVDAGSSSLAFCDPPNPDYVKDIQRVAVTDQEGELHNISQCTKYGSGGHGWFGDTFIGTIGNLTGQVFTVMKKHVGLTGNQCGPIMPGSIGLENSTIRGIMGIGRNDKFSFSDAVNETTWSEDTRRSLERCNSFAGECECPERLVRGINSTFIRNLEDHDIYQFAITWNGTLGLNTGKMLFNEDASKAIPPNFPKVPINTDRQLSFGLFGTNVTGMAVDDVLTNVTQRNYIYDTGAGYISIPEELKPLFDDGKDHKLTFYYPVIEPWDANATCSEDPDPLWCGLNWTMVEMTVTQELIDARVFRWKSGDTSPHMFGLNGHRYVDNILVHLNGTKYFQAVPREHIVDLPAKLPVGTLAGSVSNETQNIEDIVIVNETTGNISKDNTNHISQTIMNITGMSAATSIWSSTFLQYNVAVMSIATLAIAVLA